MPKICGATAPLVVWRRLWNFTLLRMKFNTVLHPNEHPQRIFFSSKTTFVEQLLPKSFQILPILQKFYLVKLCPIFGSSQSLAPWRYQKILLVSSLGCKTVLNFIWSSVKFQNRQHTSVHIHCKKNPFRVFIRV